MMMERNQKSRLKPKPKVSAPATSSSTKPKSATFKSMGGNSDVMSVECNTEYRPHPKPKPKDGDGAAEEPPRKKLKTD